MSEKSIAVIGSTTIDKIVSRDLSCYKIGGVTTYSGISYSRHGIKTFAVTNIAKRDAQIITRLKAEKIEVRRGKTEVTTHFINYIHCGTRQQKMVQRSAPISRKQVAANIKGIDFVHLGPLHPADIDIQVIKLLNNLDVGIILDIQGLVRSVKNNMVYATVSRHLAEALHCAHIVKANTAEYESIADYYQMDLSQLMNRFNINEFLVTSGAKGGCVKKITGEEIHYKAAAVKTTGDPTGAGDIFLAAYVIARILNRQTIADACNYAAKLVARQIDGNYIKPEYLDLGRLDL
ncbi:MAG: PfkB family carbohydrate kinase [Desulfobacterales bacterium]|jgi:sugar/nucleoside kinase (ribokinase family)